MSKFNEIWKEYLKEPVKELARTAVQALLSFLFRKAKDGLEKIKKHEEFEEEIVETIKVPIKEPKKVIWVNDVEHHSSRKGADISAIVIHHTGKPPGAKKSTLKQAVSWAKHKDSNISYHYVIDRDGEIYQFVKESEKAWHAGKSILHGKSNVNVFSVGVALVGDGSDGFTDEQYKSTTWVTQMLKKKYDISDPYIVGHSHIAPKRKHDPANFKWNKFFEAVNTTKL